MTAPLVVVHPDAETLATATAARLLLRLMEAQSVHSPVHVALTGGSMGARVLAAAACSPIRDAVDWSVVHVWWGDERFLPPGDPERNETQAREALLDALPLPVENVHAAPPPGPGISTPEESAVAYAAELARYASQGDDAGAAVPAFDVLLLGVGPDGHVASLFPGSDALDVVDRATVGVSDSPKPPPQRVSLTLPAIETAQEVWLVVAGPDKAPAVRRALEGAGPAEIPAAAVRGRRRTLWLLDVEAAP